MKPEIDRDEIIAYWGVDVDGNPVRYQWGAYDGMQNEWVNYFINLGGIAEV